MNLKCASQHYVVAVVTGIARTTAIAFGMVLLTSTTSIADPSDSPIAGSRNLAPVPKNYFEGGLKSVDELAVRAAITKQVVNQTGIPISPLSYDEYESLPKQFRDSRERTPSGIWKLSVLYSALGTDLLPESTLEADFDFFGGALDKWVKAQPDSPTPIMYNSIALLSYARAALYLRSTKEQITAEKMEMYQARGKHAEKYILDHLSVGSKDPHWYVLLIDAMSMRCPEFAEIEKVLEEGSARYPDYYQTYFSAIYAAAQCSTTRAEYGAAVKRIAERGLAQTASTDGSGFYARAYWYAAQYTPTGSPTSVALMDWQKMKSGMADILKRYPEPWNTNNFAKFACRADDRELMRELLPQALQRPVGSVWDEPELLARCVKSAGLETSEAN